MTAEEKAREPWKLKRLFLHVMDAIDPHTNPHNPDCYECADARLLAAAIRARGGK